MWIYIWLGIKHVVHRIQASAIIEIELALGSHTLYIGYMDRLFHPTSPYTASMSVGGDFRGLGVATQISCDWLWLRVVRLGENLVWLHDIANDDIVVILVEGIDASLWCRALFGSKISGWKLTSIIGMDGCGNFHMVTSMEASSRSFFHERLWVWKDCV
jgi:hypothetical protein